MNETEQTKSSKTKFDFRAKIISFSFMLLIFLLVTLLMPKSVTIGICLQTIAGLIFIIDQILARIIKPEDFEKLKNKINDPSFQDKIPIIGIPLISPLILVMYFKFGTNSEWYNAFFSILMAVTVSSFIYLFLVTLISNFLKKFINSRNSFLRHASYRPLLWSNIFVLGMSTIALIAEILLIYPLSQIFQGNSILTVFPTALYLTLLMFTSYWFLLSLMYFLFYFFIKLLLLSRKIYIKINESDRLFIRRLIWLFLVVFWTWGGILLIINSL